jgi:hypothetical protein
MESISELELQSLGIRRRKPRPWGWFLAGLVALGSAGFVASYYLPLTKAHDALVQEHDQLGAKAAELDHALRTTQEKLDSTEQQRARLQATEDGRAAALKATNDKLQIAKATIENVLASSIKQRRVSVDSQDAALTLEFGKAWIYQASSAKVSPIGRQLLCAAIKVVSSDMRLRATISVPVAKDAAAEDWATASEQAGAAAALLLDGCGTRVVPVGAEVRSGATASETVRLVITTEPEAGAKPSAK